MASTNITGLLYINVVWEIMSLSIGDRIMHLAITFTSLI